MYNRYLQNKCPPEKSCSPPWNEKPEPRDCDHRQDSREHDRKSDARECDRRQDIQEWDQRHDLREWDRRPDSCEKDKDNRGILSLFGKLLGGDKEGGLSKLFDDNTLLILIILFFLLKDDDGIDHDLLLLAGIFLLIGL